MANSEHSLDNFSIVTYNMHGFNQGVPMLLEILKGTDVVCVQEHWLSEFSLDDLEHLNDDFDVFSISSLNPNFILKGRPYGGLAIFVSNKLQKYCSLISKNARYIILRISNIIVINVYMPTNNQNLFSDILMEICESLASFYTVDMTLIVCGDFNYDFLRDSVQPVQYCLENFLRINGLVTTYKLLPQAGLNQFSYQNSSCGQSLIDHFFVSDELFNKISSLSIIESGINLSDHNPVLLNLRNLKIVKSIYIAKEDSLVSKLRWDKSSLCTYYDLTRLYLQPVFDSLNNMLDIECRDCMIALIENVYSDIVEALLMSDKCIIRRSVSYYKFWWDEELSYLKDQSLQSFRLWQNSGKPRSGYIFDNMNSNKFLYKTALKRKRQESEVGFTSNLAENLNSKNMPEFWKCWRGKFNKKDRGCNSVDGVSGESNIANYLGNYFSKIGQPNNQCVHEELKKDFENSYINYEGEMCDFNFSIENVDNSVAQLQKGKAAGIDKVSSEHIIYSHPILHSCLLRLFNFMLKTGYVPNTFGKGIIVPLPKNKSDQSRADNYRGITLSPVISKIFEHCLLQKFSQYFYSSDLQFGFKPNLGCTDALYTLKHTVDYFVKKGNTVNICALDVSKAFDKISQFGLYKKLLERNTPRPFIEVIKNWFSKCYGLVRWGRAFSRPFLINSGVRQGGILSPILFTVYINEILESLKSSKKGCFLNGDFIGCIFYADDILLLSISYSEMQNMLSLCEKLSKKLDLKFNVLKSQFIRIGCKFKYVCADLVLYGQPLPRVQEIKYLGIFLKEGKTFSTSNANAKIKFYRSFNAIYSKCKYHCPENVLVALLKSYCIPLLLYGLEAINPSRRYLTELDKVIDQACMKIFKTFDKNIIDFLKIMFDIPAISQIVNFRKIKMYERFESNNLYFKHSILSVFGLKILL